MTPDLHRLQDSIRAFRRELELHPLASFRCWERIPVEGEEVDPERFSQIDTVRALVHHKTVVVWGGSRSGKTAGMMAATIALALGSDHPDSRAFWELNGVDPDVFPRGPAKVWFVALTSNDSLQYHRPQVVALLPRTGPEHPRAEVRGQPWHDWGIDAKGQARIDVMVPGYAEPAKIVFKSEVPGEDAAKGDECRAILHDEEGKTPEFFFEAEKRLWDQDGWQILCNAPTKKGKRWAWHRFVGAQQERTWVGWLWAMDNPHISQARVKQQTGNDALIRTKGKFIDAEGTAFPWSATRQVVTGLAALIPADWARHRVIDWGYRDPFCCEWMTWSRSPIVLPDGRVLGDGSVLVYREYYQAEVTLQGHAQTIHVLEGWIRGPEGRWTRGPATEKVVGGWADSESAANIAAFTDDYGLPVEKAIKGRSEGIPKLASMCQGDDAGPRFFVDSTCVQLITQLAGAQFTDTRREELVPGEDHALDVARYGVMGLTALYGAKQNARAVTRGMKQLFTRLRR